MKIIDITSKHITIDDRTKAYAEKKVRKLIDYIPRHARKSASVEVKIEKVNQKGGDTIECEFVLNLPNKQLVAKELRDGAMAAIDSVESKMRGQIRRYKVEHKKDRADSGVLSRIKKSLRRR
jgi:ribosomal subunit interface protein